MNKKVFVAAGLAVLLLASVTVSALELSKRNTVAIKPENVTTVSAPEQTEPQEHPDFKMEAFTPVAPEGTNIAIKKKITSSGDQPSCFARKAIDGNAEGASYWEGKANTFPNTISLDFAQESSIHAVRICLNPESLWEKRTQTFSVKTSADGESYTELVPSADYAFDPKTGNYVIIDLPEGTKTRYLQLEFTANSSATGGQIAELEVYSK